VNRLWKERRERERKRKKEREREREREREEPASRNKGACFDLEAMICGSAVQPDTIVSNAKLEQVE